MAILHGQGNWEIRLHADVVLNRSRALQRRKSPALPVQPRLGLVRRKCVRVYVSECARGLCTTMTPQSAPGAQKEESVSRSQRSRAECPQRASSTMPQANSFQFNRTRDRVTSGSERVESERYRSQFQPDVS